MLLRYFDILWDFLTFIAPIDIKLLLFNLPYRDASNGDSFMSIDAIDHRCQEIP